MRADGTDVQQLTDTMGGRHTGLAPSRATVSRREITRPWSRPVRVQNAATPEPISFSHRLDAIIIFPFYIGVGINMMRCQLPTPPLAPCRPAGRPRVCADARPGASPVADAPAAAASTIRVTSTMPVASALWSTSRDAVPRGD